MTQITLPTGIDVGDLGELTTALRLRREDILRSWLAAINQRGRQSGGLSEAEAADLLNALVGGVPADIAVAQADELGPLAERDSVGLIRVVRRLADLLPDCQLLGRIVIERVTYELARPLTPVQTQLFYAHFDQISGRLLSRIIDRQVDELVAASGAQSKYMSFLAHDLRGSLNGLILMLEVMRREMLQRPELAEPLEDVLMMRKSVHETVEVMERHSLVERLRSGRVDIKMRPMNPAITVTQAISDRTGAATAKKLELVNDVPPALTIFSDPELVAIVIGSLLDNAINFSSSGRVTVNAEVVTTGAGGCGISVIDQGSGIEPDRLTQLLDPILRVNIKERGLGLVIAQYAARLLGGCVRAQSVVGQGSTFRLIVPIK